MNKIKKFLLAGLLLFLVLFATQSIFAGNDTLKLVNFGGDIPGITPLSNSFDPDSYSVITQIFDSLIHIDLDGNLVPALATSWKQLSPTSFEFNLRRGVKFHNGEPFNATAVKYTYDKVLDPETGSGTAWILSTIKSVKIINNYKVQIDLNHPDGMFLYRFSMFGCIVPPKYTEKVGVAGIEKYPIGTGPFKFVSWEKGKEIVLDANKNYWQPGIPKVNKVIFKILPEKQWAKNLIKGELDFVPALSGKDTIKVRRNKDLKVIKRLVLSSYWVLLKNEGPLADVRVRKALNYAVNKKEMIKKADYGNGKVMASLGKEGELGHNPNLTPYSYNPEKAKKLLAEAGYETGFTIDCIAADLTETVAKRIKKDLEKVNIKINLKVVSRPEWAKTVIVGKMTGNPYKGHMAINLVDNPIMNMSFHAGLFLGSPSPWAMLNMPEYDKAYVGALTQADPNAHEAALKKLDQFIHDNALLLFTYQRIRTCGMKKNVNIDKVGINGHLDYFTLSEASL